MVTLLYTHTQTDTQDRQPHIQRRIRTVATWTQRKTIKLNVTDMTVDHYDLDPVHLPFWVAGPSALDSIARDRSNHRNDNNIESNKY